MAGTRPAVGRLAADPGGQGHRPAQGPPARHVALGAHAAAAGRHARLRDGVAAPEHRARPGGEALLLDDGAGRVASYRGVAEADRRGGRHRGARPSPRRARAHDPRGGHARGEGLPDAGLLRAADHLALPPDCPSVARNGARRPLQPLDDGRRHPPRRRDGLREGAASEGRQEDEAGPRRRCQPVAPDLCRTRALAAEGAGLHRQHDALARHREAEGGHRDRCPSGAVARPRRQRRPASVLVVTATLMEGRPLAERIRAQVAEEVRELGDVGLATVQVGEDPASTIYIRLKHEAAAAAGFRSVDRKLSADLSQDDLASELTAFSADDLIEGILLQLPLPDGLDEAAAVVAIAPAKDVDGVHPFNAGQLYLGRPTLVPATPLGIMALLEEHQVRLDGARAVVIGRSDIVGKPIAHLLLQANATVTLCHSHTDELERHTLDADVLVVAVGIPRVISPDMVKVGGAVVDGGINRTESGIVDDVDPGAAEVASFMTPVPRGVGPMTIALLLRNAVRCARYRRNALAFPGE